MRRVVQALALAAALAAVPAAALLPVYQWEVQGAQNNQNVPSVVQMAASGITVAATSTVIGTYQITGINTATGAVVWTQQTLCTTLVGVYPVPNAAAVDAITVAVCSDVFVGIVPSNGTFQWTIMPGVSGTLSPQANTDNSQPQLPVVITPSSETSSDKFVIPLYPANGNSGLTLLAVVDPSQGRVTSAEVPCFDTIQAIHATGPKDFLTIVCAPGSQATFPGPTTVKGVSIASGRLAPLWEWIAPNQLSAATAASETTVLALAYRLASAPTTGFTSYYTIDIATGAASELNVNQLSAAQPFLVNGYVPTVAWAGGMNFAFVEEYTFSIGGISGNTLSFATTRMGNTNGNNINFMSIVAIPDAGMQQVVLAENNNDGDLVFTAYNPSSGAVLLNFMPNGQTYGTRLRVDYCPDSRKVLVWGYNQISSWIAIGSPYTVLFTANLAATSASILQDYVAVSGQSSAYGIINVAGNTWEVAQTNTGSASFATSNGAIFTMTPDGVAAYGSRGTRLWLTPFSVGNAAAELVVMKDIVALVIGAVVIGMSQTTGTILFEITLTASKSNGFSCSVPVTGSALVAGASLTAAVDSFLVIGQTQGDNNVQVTNAPPACTYLVRADGTAMTLQMTSIQSAVRAANSNDLIVQSDTTSARIDGWTGATKWSTPVFVGVQGSTVYATNNVIYIVATSSGNSGSFVSAIDATTGTNLFNQPTPVVTPVGVLGDGLLTQLQTYNSVTGNYEYVISFVVPKIAANGSVVASTSWSYAWNSDNSYFVGLRGVLVGFGGPACSQPSSYYAQCMAGYSAVTGAPLWSINDIGTNCNGVTVALGGAVAVASCGSTLKAVDPLTGAVRFVASFPYQTFRVTADVVIQQSGAALAGAIIPAANLVRALVNASASLPMPPPFQLPAGYTPAPSAAPGPAPVPSANNLGGNADVAWSMETPGSTATVSYDGAASTSAVNGVVLIASSAQLTFVMADSGSAFMTVPAPPDCVAANTQPRVYASPAQFFCECGALTITSYDSAGTKLWSTVIPGGGSTGNNGQLPFLLSDGSILVPTAATTTALANIVLSNGTSIFLRLPEEFSESQQTVIFDSVPAGGFIVYAGSVLGVYTPAGDQMWNHTLDRSSFNKINLAVGVANGDVVAIVTANNDNAIAIRFTADAVIWRVLVETSAQEGSDFPQGVLTAGTGTAADFVYFGSTATNVVYGLQVSTGRIIWSFTTDYSSVSTLIGMGATEQCCIFTGVLSNYNNDGNTYASVTCADPATGNVRFNVTYMYNGEQDAVTVSASPSPDGNSVLVAAGRYIANISLVTKQPFWGYARAQYYGGQFAPAKYIPTADGTGRVIVSVDGSSNPIRALVASVSPDRFVFAAETGNNVNNNNNAPNGSPFVSITGGAAVAIVANGVLYAASTSTGAVQWSTPLSGGLPPTSSFTGSAFVTAFATYVVVARNDRLIVVDSADGSIVSTYSYAGLSSTCNPTGFGALSLFVEDGHLVLNINNCLYFFSSTLRIHGFRLTQSLVEPPRGVSNLITFQAQDGAVVALQPDGVQVWSAPVHELAGYYGAPAASNSGGSSFLFTATYDGYLTSRFGATGAIVWRARAFPRPTQQQQTFYPMPPAVIGNVVLVATPSGVSAFDASLTPKNADRIVWQTSVPGVSYSNQQNSPPLFKPVVTTVGVAVFFLDSVLFGVNYTDGTVLWSKSATCTSALSFGRYVIAACDDVVALDPVTGRGVAQLGFGLTTQGLAVFGDPLNGNKLPRVAVAFNPQSNTGLGAVSISSLIATSVLPAASPVPTPSQAPATLPPNYVPDVPVPIQGRPFFDYATTPPHGEINFTWPVLSETQIAANVPSNPLFQSRTTLVTRVGKQLMGYSIAIGSALWTVSIPSVCVYTNGQTGIQTIKQAKGNTLLMYCYLNNDNNNNGAYTLVYLSESTGKVIDTVMLNSLSADIQDYVADPVSNALIGSFETYRYDPNSGSYVYTYGALGASPTSQWSYNCSSITSSQTYPTVTAYNGYAVVICTNGQVAWIDAASGDVAAEFAAANQTAATAISSEGRYVALLGSSSLSASQVTLFDGKERKIVGFYGLNPTLSTTNFVLVPDNAGSVWFVQVYSSNQTLNGYKLPLSAGTSGVQISRSWNSAPFAAYTMVNQQQLAAFVSGTNIFVNAYGANGAVSLTTGATLWANYPSGIYSVSYVSASPTADVVLFASSGLTVAYKMSTGQLLTQGPGATMQPDGIANAENCAVVSGDSNGQGFSCFSVSPVTAGWARHTHSNNNQGVSPSTNVVGLLNGNIIASTAYDVSSFNAATGTQQYSLTLSAGHTGYPVLAGTKLVAFTTFGEVWVIDATTGVVGTTLVLPLCNGAVSPGASDSAVFDGNDLLFTGGVGCLYRLSFAAATPALTLVAASGASELTTVVIAPTQILWVDDSAGLHAFDRTTLAKQWTLQMPDTGFISRGVVAYGAFVYVTSTPRTLLVLKAIDGAVAREIPAVTHLLTGAMTAYNGAIWAVTNVGIAKYPADPTSTAAPTHMVTVGADRSVSSYLAQTPKVSADGVLVYTSNVVSAAIDTLTGVMLWNSSSVPSPHTNNRKTRPDTFVILGDVIVGGVEGNFAVRGLRSGNVLRSWGISAPSYGGRVLVSGDVALYATYLNSIAGLPIGINMPAAPVPTATAPANSNVPTAPPPTPFATQAASAASLGCVRRIDTETAQLRACVSSTVVAPLYEGRAAGVSTLDCARGAPALAACVANYAATMAGCGAGIAYLREVLASINATGAPLAACGRAGVCTTAAGEAAFCAALGVPAWAAAAGPLPATGLPPIPTFTSAAATTPAPPPTTAAPPTTMAPPTTPAPPTTTAAPLPPLSAVLALRLLAGAAVPTRAQLAAELQQALTLAAPADIQLFGVQPGGAALDDAAATVLFAFRGVNAASLALRTRALPAATLASVLHASSVGPVAPPPTPPPTTATPSAAPQTTTTTSGAPQPPGPTTTGAPTSSGAPTPTPTATPPTPTPTSTGAPQPPSTATPQPVSELLALVLQPGAAVPTAAVLATELQAALALTAAPAVTVVGLERGDTVIFTFVGAGAGRLAQAYLALPAATLQRDLHASKAAPATGAGTPSGGDGGSKGGTPAWVIPVVAVVGVALLLVVVMLVVKRKALFGTPAIDVADSRVHSGTAAELASGRINTGGEYARYEDMA